MNRITDAQISDSLIHANRGDLFEGAPLVKVFEELAERRALDAHQTSFVGTVMRIIRHGREGHVDALVAYAGLLADKLQDAGHAVEADRVRRTAAGDYGRMIKLAGESGPEPAIPATRVAQDASQAPPATHGTPESSHGHPDAKEGI